MVKRTSKPQRHNDGSDRESVSKRKITLPEEDDDFDDSDDDDVQADVFGKVAKKDERRILSEENESEDDEIVDDEGDDSISGDEDDEANDDDDDDELVDNNDVAAKKLKKLNKFTPDQLEKQQKRIRKTGVCYLSKIPPYMRPSKLRSVMTRFGKIDRLFLKPEDTSTHSKRVKYGGNKKRNYTEGWVEFVNKKDAKLAVATLNANTLGGKKTSYYYDDIINIKYLSGFKWLDLTQQIAKENEIRQAKLALELSQQQKLNKTFINNVEKSKVISRIERKRKEKDPSTKEDDKVRRNFKQRKVTSTRADAHDTLKERSKPNEKLNDVLSKLF